VFDVTDAAPDLFPGGCFALVKVQDLWDAASVGVFVVG
jgi:hypothetical protein